MLLKTCRCGKLITQGLKMCEKCEAQTPSRHMKYNETRRDPKAAAFYISLEWRTIRPVVMDVYDYIDIYALHINHELITLKESDPIHHIIELEEDYEQRLNPLNLIPVSKKTHNTITALYKKNNTSMIATQTQIRELIEHHFKEAGGINKVLERHFLVAPSFKHRENSPREIREKRNFGKGVRM